MGSTLAEHDRRIKTSLSTLQNCEQPQRFRSRAVYRPRGPHQRRPLRRPFGDQIRVGANLLTRIDITWMRPSTGSELADGVAMGDGVGSTLLPPPPGMVPARSRGRTPRFIASSEGGTIKPSLTHPVPPGTHPLRVGLCRCSTGGYGRQRSRQCRPFRITHMTSLRSVVFWERLDGWLRNIGARAMMMMVPMV
jgi:hypothetical protein